MSYQVGIDPGTTSTVAAVCRPGSPPQVVPLGGRTGPVPSVVHLGGDGSLLVGEAAERRALSDPGRVVRELIRRVGDGTPVLVGREPVAAEELAARFLARLVDDVARREGDVASRVAVTHPAGWGPHRVGSLRAALAEHGLGSALLVPEPLAVAAGHAAAAPVADGAAVGVYDLGGGRFDAAVVRRRGGGFEPAGIPEGIERFGGADLDEVVFAHVRTALGPAWDALDSTDPDVLAAVADLRRECTAAKEALSDDTEVLVRVALPGVRTDVRLGRAEFEEMIRPGVAETVEAMRRAIDGAGEAPAGLAALVLTGGSSRIPLVPQLLGEAFGRAVTVVPDPVGAAALGAALIARGATGTAAGGARPAAGAPCRPAVAGPVADAGGAATAGGRATDTGRGRRGADGSAPVDRPADAAGQAGGHRAGASDDPPEEGGSEGGTALLPVARPPKQARPFVPGAAPTTRTRRVALVASAGALALTVLGGVVAFGVGRIGAGTEAGAATPASVVEPGVPGSSTVEVPAPSEAREAPPAPPAGRRTRSAPPRATTGTPPPASTTAPPTTEETAETEQETAAPEPTAEPADPGDGGNGDGGNGDGGNGDGGTADAGGDTAAEEGAGPGAAADAVAAGEAPAGGAEGPAGDGAADDGGPAAG